MPVLVLDGAAMDVEALDNDDVEDIVLGNIVDRFAGAGASNVSVVGLLQVSSPSVFCPQHAHRWLV